MARRVLVYLEEEQYEEVRLLAFGTRTSISEQVREALTKHLKEVEKNEK